MPRFQGFSNSEDSFVSYPGIIEIIGVIITPSVSCNIWASFFLHFKCVPFSLLKNTSSLTNVAPRKIGARNFIQNIGLKFNWRPKLEGREILLQGLVWSSNNINSILSAKKTCDGFCDITNIRDSGHGGGFIFTESNWITCPLILSDEAENVDQSSSSINENNWFVN